MITDGVAEICSLDAIAYIHSLMELFPRKKPLVRSLNDRK